MSQVLCSVVVPSHDRPSSLDRVLAALARQTVPVTRFEVVVVLDGPSPASVDVLKRYRQDGHLPGLRWLEQPRQGQAAARNAGAAVARGPVLLFIDDDVVPEPGLIETHLRHHRGDEPVAVLGDSRFVRSGDSYYDLLSWAWWEDLFAERAQPDRPASLYDFCAGNVSVGAGDFHRVGGFDSAFTGYGGEDYELGYRLLRAGVRFVPDRAACAAHHHGATVEGVLRKTRQEARGDLLLIRKHPELHRAVRMTKPIEGPIKLVARAAVQVPWLADQFIRLLALALRGLQAARLRHLWIRGFKAVRTYAYWRGVGEALGSWKALQRLRQETPQQPEIAMDVTDGLPEALPEIPPAGAIITVEAGGRTLGRLVLDARPREPLRPWLAREIVRQLGPQLQPSAAGRPWWLDPESLAHG